MFLAGVSSLAVTTTHSGHLGVHVSKFLGRDPVGRHYMLRTLMDCVTLVGYSQMESSRVREMEPLCDSRFECQQLESI